MKFSSDTIAVVGSAIGLAALVITMNLYGWARIDSHRAELHDEMQAFYQKRDIKDLATHAEMQAFYQRCEGERTTYYQKIDGKMTDFHGRLSSLEGSFEVIAGV